MSAQRGLVVVVSFLFLVSCTSDAAAPKPVTEPITSSPIADRLGISSFEPERDQALLSKQAENEHVRECMAELGFDYQPADPSETIVMLPGSELAQPEFSAQFGYGVSTNYDERTRLQQQSPVTENSEASETALGMSLQECEAEYAASLEKSPYDSLTESLGPQLDEMRQSYESDERVVRLNLEWTTCMAGQGLTYGSREEPQAEAIQALTLFQIDTSHTLSGGLTADQLDELAAIQDRERAVAQVDYQCSSSIDERLTAIRWEYEAAFVVENGDGFD